jgi:hypothetical protein
MRIFYKFWQLKKEMQNKWTGTDAEISPWDCRCSAGHWARSFIRGRKDGIPLPFPFPHFMPFLFLEFSIPVSRK